jgi:transcription elongation factor Elf1
MPKYLIRLMVVFVIGVIVALGVQRLLVPKSFGVLGHYRASALKEVAAQKPVYAGQEACGACHEDEAAVKKTGRHAGLPCEVCHGASAAHAEDPTTRKPFTELDRSFCLRCHEKNVSRPPGFPMVSGTSHNLKDDCRQCHKPHAPSVKKGGAP